MSGTKYDQDKAPLLIGICGEVGAGKDTSAQLLSREFFIQHGKLPACRRFFEGGKEALAVLTGWPLYYFEDREYKEKTLPPYNVSPRQIMEWFGTEFVRKFLGQDFWIKKLNMNIEKENNDIVLIHDTRFPNEVQYIRDKDGVILHVSRPNNPLRSESNHSSNTPVPVIEGDLVITASSLEELEKACIKKAEEIAQEEKHLPDNQANT